MKVVLARKPKGHYKKAFLLFEIDHKQSLYGIAKGKVGECSMKPKNGWLYDIFDIRWSDQRAYWHERRIFEWIQSQCGKKQSIFREGFKLSSDTDPEWVQEKRKASGKWSDAELVFAALRKGGVRIFGGNWQWPHAVTPHTLALCPNLGYLATIKKDNAS
jgi:hypothetical protein